MSTEKVQPREEWVYDRAVELAHGIFKSLANTGRTITTYDQVGDWIDELKTLNSQLCSMLIAEQVENGTYCTTPPEAFTDDPAHAPVPPATPA